MVGVGGKKRWGQTHDSEQLSKQRVFTTTEKNNDLITNINNTGLTMKDNTLIIFIKYNSHLCYLNCPFHLSSHAMVNVLKYQTLATCQNSLDKQGKPRSDCF